MELIERPVVLPRLAFHLAWNLAGLGPPPAVIGPGNYYLADDARAELERNTLDTLTRLDLARRGTLDPALRNTLSILDYPTREYYCWSHIREDDSAGAVLAAARERDAVRVITDHRVVMLDPIEAHRLADCLVDTLPDVAGAAIGTLDVPRDALTGTADNDDDPLAEPVSDRHAERLAEFLRADRDAVHQLYTAVRATRAAPRRRSTPLTALDLTGRGRVLTYLAPDRNDEPTRITLTSGSRPNLVAALTATQRRL